MANILKKVKEFFSKVGSFFVKLWATVAEFFTKVWTKSVEFFKEKTKNIKWKDVWDKCTTGLLIVIFCSPLIVLGYIFLWFLLR